tara:strand:+ start:1844 stop:2662 length:819 start_codon:yes stop_codon:yes gene_type:complete
VITILKPNIIINFNMTIIQTIIILSILLYPSTFIHIGAQEEVNVEIVDGSEKVDNVEFYIPARITIPIGTTVIWKNFDNAPHTVTSGTPDCPGMCWGIDFDSGIMKQDKLYEIMFKEVGEYNYLCSLHPWMTGTVTVLDKEQKMPAEDVIIVQKGTINGNKDGVDIRITAKQIRNLILIHIRNAESSDTSVYGITIETSNSVIEAYRGPKNWDDEDVTSNKVTSYVDDEALNPGAKTHLKLKVSNNDFMINWTVYDSSHNTIDQGKVRPIRR